MATTTETEGRRSGVARRLIVPAVISLAGSAAGLLLTQRQKVREAAPRLREAASDLGGVGDLTGGLREKLDEVLGREPAAEADVGANAREIDWTDYEQRRRERQERRDRRRQRSRR